MILIIQKSKVFLNGLKHNFENWERERERERGREREKKRNLVGGRKKRNAKIKFHVWKCTLYSVRHCCIVYLYCSRVANFFNSFVWWVKQIKFLKTHFLMWSPVVRRYTCYQFLQYLVLCNLRLISKIDTKQTSSLFSPT